MKRGTRRDPRDRAATLLQVAQIALCLVVAAGCGRGRNGHPREPAPSGPSSTPSKSSAALPRRSSSTTDSTAEAGEPTLTEMRNVHLRIAEGVVLEVRHLEGRATPVQRGTPVALDDKTSYTIRVESAEAFIGYPDLSRVLNTYTFAFKGAPIRDLKMSREHGEGEEDEIQLKGRLRKALGLAFEIEGRPEATPDGKIRIRTTSIQALDVEVGGLMHALGLEAKDVLGNLEERGVKAVGDDMILDPDRAFPPPRITGLVTEARVEAKGLVLTFGEPRRGAPAEADTANYLWFRKGTIRIGKMTQHDADLRIVDQDPHDPLDFSADHMPRQLVAGYAKLDDSGGLTMFVPDYGDIR